MSPSLVLRLPRSLDPSHAPPALALPLYYPQSRCRHSRLLVSNVVNRTEPSIPLDCALDLPESSVSLSATHGLLHPPSPNNPLHSPHINMALKRINKELTDLGRYVPPLFLSLSLLSPPPISRGGAAVTRRGLCTFINNLVSMRTRRCAQGYVTDSLGAVVTLRRPARPGPSEMTWYVVPQS
jgi:hypothetical protein